MIGRVPRHAASGDRVDPGSLFVFIPGALAGGFLISIGLLVGDAVRRLKGDASAERRVRLTGAALVDEIRAGAGASGRTELGLRPLAVYGFVGGISLALVLLVLFGATWNFFNPGGYIEQVAWIWAISMLLAFGFAIVAMHTLRLAPRWLPGILAALGLGFALRFALGREPAIDRAILVGFGLALAIIGPAVTWRSGRGRGVAVPPSARPILTRTPLTRPE